MERNVIKSQFNLKEHYVLNELLIYSYDGSSVVAENTY